MYKDNLHLNVCGVDASEDFYAVLKGVVDPEEKRKAIGAKFIDVFDAEAHKIGDVKWLVQGTLYPDVIESVSLRGASVTIKTHHNVGGLPGEDEPETDRAAARIVQGRGPCDRSGPRYSGRDPCSDIRFPGPDSAFESSATSRPKKSSCCRKPTRSLSKSFTSSDYIKMSGKRSPCLLPIQSVGVMGDFRTYEKTVALRAVTSTDGMTADWARLPHDFLAKVSSRITSEVRGVNRVVYDISSKPPSTIEWE